MEEKLRVVLANDSFPPTIDGVANTVLNYAKHIQLSHGTPMVATPAYPDVVDDYPFDEGHSKYGLEQINGISKGFKAVFSEELPIGEAIVKEEGRNKKSNVGTISYLPAVFGCACAQAAIAYLRENHVVL